MKIVVFDLDETLGYFTEYGIFWDSLKNYLTFKNKRTLTQEDFNNTLDLFPEFLRPNIINILTYLKNKKNSKCCNKMMIYTNNQGPKEWSHKIINYFENKIKSKLFDQIIAAFKVNGKIVEICRTTHNKTHYDFIKCTKLPHNAEICFLDDNFYPDMSNENIYYINVKPYYHDLTFDYMIQKFKDNSGLFDELIKNDENCKDFNEYMISEIGKYKYDVNLKNEKDYEIDEIIGKQIILHLQEFFYISKKNKTRRNIRNRINKTKRKIN
jgi:hypothetical protein